MAVVIDGTNGITTPLDVEIQGATSGSIIIAAPAVAGTNTQTLVAATGTLAPLIAGTAVASTSGTSISFTSIPSWVKRITMTVVGMSTNGSSFKQLQMGTGGVATTSGYLGDANQNATGVLFTTGIGLASNAAGDVCQGAFTLINHSGNTWVGTYTGGKSDAITGHFSGGSVTLSGPLDMVRLTTVNGTDTFDAGSINIMYE